MKKPSSIAMPAPKCPKVRAFTLIELMLSTAVLALLMALMLTVVGQTQQIWVRSSGKVSQFQASRTAFEAMTRNLSQATLNTYYDLQFTGGSTKGYSRNSDLHFVSGQAAQAKFLGKDSDTYPTHAVFFQAPLGMTGETTGTGATEAKKYRTLSNLLTAAGYYVKWGKDQNLPPFITLPDRYRYRLMEVIQPTESLGVNDTVRLPKANDWIQTALGLKSLPGSSDPNAPAGTKDSSRVLAENVVALIILPKLSDKDTAAATTFLAPNYEYDSRPADGAGKPKTWASLTKGTSEYNQFDQLPPVVRVTMVCIDEPSAVRQQSVSTSAPKWTSNLFTSATKEDDVAKDLGDPEALLPDTLIYRLAPPPGTLATPKMNYRIYTMDVVIRGSKWSF